MIFRRYDVVVVPFPFVDKPKTKKRPTLVLSNLDFNKSGHTILAMITTKQHPSWPGDSQIGNYASAGLRFPCLVRFKFFTLDNRLLLRKIGHLSKKDSNQIEKHLCSYLVECG
ncbi:MAG: type II toxin-antitoxin system PemK/MazF family toxin [Candidatus Saganbacteria bacterium]|nr:type II toxin-antitoxin system PemK/MazF family toxin [Candidatus Saganbacteria bacterium]